MLLSMLREGGDSWLGLTAGLAAGRVLDLIDSTSTRSSRACHLENAGAVAVCDIYLTY